MTFRTTTAPDRRDPERMWRRALASFALGWVLLLTASATAGAGTLTFFEGSASPGAPRMIASPASDVLLDVDYSASTGEGGGIYGFSEIRIGVSGDLTLTSSGFFCMVTSCLFAPFPWTGGNEIAVTGGEDLGGETAGSLDLMTISVSGTQGLVFVYLGEYLDATGDGSSVGLIQSVEPTVIAVVPEPGFAIGLGLGAAALAARRPRRTV
ncbi:MAG: PEP-CTERM sorting domain-containing protein [Myxococcota bacterium]